MDEIVLEAKREILALRRRNELLAAKVEVMDLFACVLFTKPAERVETMAPDVVHRLEVLYTKLNQPAS